MKGRSCLPNDPKIIVCICFGAFWICNKMLSYDRITVHFRMIVFTHEMSINCMIEDYFVFFEANEVLLGIFLLTTRRQLIGVCCVAH